MCLLFNVLLFQLCNLDEYELLADNKKIDYFAIIAKRQKFQVFY